MPRLDIDLAQRKEVFTMTKEPAPYYHPDWDIYNLGSSSTEAEDTVLVDSEETETIQTVETTPATRSRGGRPPNPGREDVAFLTEFPRPLIVAAKGMFPELGTQTDRIVAALLYFGIDAHTLGYQPPEHIAAAVKRLRADREGADMQDLHDKMGALHKKLHTMSDQILQQQMLIAYLATLASGMHPAGKVHTGHDLQLLHEGVLTTTKEAQNVFPQYKDIVKNREGRDKYEAKNRKRDA